MLKLGSQTGSLVNHVYSRYTGVTPVIGMGATLLSWSDRSPATVVELFTKGKFNYVVLQADNYKRTDKNGMSEIQEYEYTCNPEGGKRTFRINEDGSLSPVYLNENGRYIKGSGGAVLGVRERYYDFSH